MRVGSAGTINALELAREKGAKFFFLPPASATVIRKFLRSTKIIGAM